MEVGDVVMEMVVKCGNKSCVVELDRGKDLLEVFWKNGIDITALCQGNGTCGKCKIMVLKGEFPVTEADKRKLTEKEIGQGIRLACKVNVKDVIEKNEKVTIEIVGEKEEEIEVQGIKKGEYKSTKIEEKTKKTEGVSKIKKEQKGTENRGDNRKTGEEEHKEKEYFIAIDIGTTTIAMALVENESGEICDIYSCLNHQRKYGADVISRIKSANDGKSDELKKLIEKDLWKGIQELSGAQDRKCLKEEERIEPIYYEKGKKLFDDNYDCKKILKVVIVGNTTMIHLLMGYSCESLGKYPFRSEHLSELCCTLGDCVLESCGSAIEQIPTMILPGISAFVGADVVAGMLACEGFESEKINLFIDLGTNGEMVLGNKDKIAVTSTAAGPAFEGGNITCGCAGIPGAISKIKIQNQRAVIKTIKNVIPPVGICGSGLISAISQLRKNKLLDEQGKFRIPYEKQGYSLWSEEEGKKVVLYQQDIRQFQLAKAAIRAGIELMMKEYGCTAEEVEKVYLAGGFGTEILEEEALETGILPKEFRGKVKGLGNAALKGCVEYGLQHPNTMPILGKRSVKVISLSQMEEFQEIYVRYMDF